MKTVIFAFNRISTNWWVCLKISGEVRTVKTLLEQGVEVNDKNHDQSTPLHLSSRNGNNHKSSINAELTLLNSLDFLLGHTTIAKLLLEKGANVNALGTSNRTPLHEAAYFGI